MYGVGPCMMSTGAAGADLIMTDKVPGFTLAAMRSGQQQQARWVMGALRLRLKSRATSCPANKGLNGADGDAPGGATCRPDLRCVRQ